MLRSIRSVFAIALVAGMLSGCGVTVFGGDDDDVENDSASFEVSGNRAIMKGVIDDDTPDELDEVLDENPEVNTIVLQNVPGSIDDEALLTVAATVRERGLTTYVPALGRISGGGTEFFIAGITRIAERGAQIGVHSWKTDEGIGAQLQVSDEAHVRYLNYYRQMGIPEEFYWFSLRAAGPDTIHWMGEGDLVRFRVVQQYR